MSTRTVIRNLSIGLASAAVLSACATGGSYVQSDPYGNPTQQQNRTGKGALIGTAIGTSLDALAVGVSLAILDVNILVIAIAIGSATFIMASGGMMIGRMIGERFRRAAGIVAGVALCGLGSLILIEHLA